jgi:hypothetical protein
LVPVEIELIPGFGSLPSPHQDTCWREIVNHDRCKSYSWIWWKGPTSRTFEKMQLSSSQASYGTTWCQRSWARGARRRANHSNGIRKTKPGLGLTRTSMGGVRSAT